MRKVLFSLLILPGLLMAKSKYPAKDDAVKQGQNQSVNITVGEVWNHFTNFGDIGGDFNGGYYGYDWPGGGVHNYYLWGGYFVVGAKVGAFHYVTYTLYPAGNGEWAPADEPMWYGPRYSAFDVYSYMQDFKDENPRNASGRHLGIKVIFHTLAWPHEPYNDFIAHEIYITYDKDQCDIPGHGDQLDSVFVAMWYDCDVSGADASDPHIDDLVGFDGSTNGEWNNPDFHFHTPVDTLTLLPDSVINQPDGVNDAYLIWGDEPGEVFADSTRQDAWDIQVGDTVIRGYLVPRGMSYIYDGDNPSDPGNDVGEHGMSAGYIGGAWIYAPPSPADSVWIGPSGDTCRIVRPVSHQWWNWESDPATDDQVWLYLIGNHPATQGYRYAPHPFDLGASVFDYRFLNTVGPFTLKSGDTLKLVWVAGVGQGLNGGVDNYWRGGKWVHGLRHVIDWAYKAYYTGSEHSDPIHPSAPDKDKHWKIPVPPISPSLIYSSTPEGIKLVWDDLPEKTPDPVKGYIDFAYYRIYRAMYAPQTWVKIAEVRRSPDGSFSHSYVDTTATPGFPYYYTVVSVDEDSLESAKSNYLKDAEGNPKAIVQVTEPTSDLDKIRVVPNPYMGSEPWTATELADKVEFQNLPPACKISIFTLAGDLVKELYHNNGTGTEAWNLLNESGQKVVSGVYIYKVETPDGKSKVGRFMILK